MKFISKKPLPFISIVIPVKNGEKLIGNCIRSLTNLNYPKDKYEIIVVDGLSTDNTVKVAQSYGAKIVHNYKQTVSPGRNVGFNASIGELIAFSDDDCVMDKNWLINSVKYFENEKKVGGIGGSTLTPVDESDFGKAVSFLFKLGIKITGSVHKDKIKSIRVVKDIPGCNAIYRREILEKVMPINEYLLTGDDIELNFRIRKEGYRLLEVPDVFLWHYRRPTPKRLCKQLYRFAIGRLQVGKLDIRMINLAHIIIGLFIPFLVVSVILFYLMFPSKLLCCFVIVLTISTLFIACIAYYEYKSLKISLYTVLAIVIAIFSWSFGFLRELIFPMRKVAGK